MSVSSLYTLKRLSMVSFLGLGLAACLPAEDEHSHEHGGSIDAPQITMNLPSSLSGVVASGTNGKANVAGLATAPVDDPSQCEEYFDPHANFMDNGYAMTRFLVGLSQQQSCFADFIMSQILANAHDWIGQGPVQIPVDANDPEAPSHVQVEQSGDTYQVWLFFATPGEALPADLSTVQTVYLTWTGSGSDVQGRFYMVNMPLDTSDPDAPEGIRVDFTRTASTADNKIYIDMRTGHSAGMGGFRVDVNQTGSGVDAQYNAQGLITFLGQPFPNLPAGLDLPEFSAAAVVDADGLGAATASFNKFAVSLINDVDGNGTTDSAEDQAAGEWNLGSYQFDINDKTYFDPSLYDSTVQTAFITQITEWRNKSVSGARYVSDQPRDTNANNMLTCLESATGCGGVPGWDFGTGYFSDPTLCDDDATASTDCNAFIGKLFEQDMFGISALNSTTPEPSADWRNAQLDSLLQLSSVHPSDDPSGATTFDIPAAPAH